MNDCQSKEGMTTRHHIFLLSLFLITSLCVVWRTSLYPSESFMPLDIQSSKEDAYFEKVYKGTSPPHAMSLRNVTLFYQSILLSSGIHLPFRECRNGMREGSLYRERVWLDSDDYRFSYSSKRDPLPDRTWVEVTHCPLDQERGFGSYWMYWSPGSGNWVNTGRTLSFERHEDALVHFGIEMPSSREENYRGTLSLLPSLARREGLDTVQFLLWDDMSCGNLAIEIVNVWHRGNETCGPESRAGWEASLPCNCSYDPSDKKRCFKCV